jgi:hypothetical protein
VLFKTGTVLFKDAIAIYHKKYPDDDKYLIIHPNQLDPCNAFNYTNECLDEAKHTSFAIHH